MLTEVGEENIDLLIAASYPGCLDRYHLTQATIQLASPRSKDAILNALRSDPHLIAVVLKYGWEEDAKEVLLHRLRERYPFSTYLPEGWVRAVAQFKAPSAYDALINHFVHGQDRYVTYTIIKDLPGIELDAHVAEAWEMARRSNDWERVRFAIVAIGYGMKDALALLIANLDESRFVDFSSSMRTAISRHTAAQGTNAQLVEWYEANKDNLTFDKETRKFRKKT